MDVRIYYTVHELSHDDKRVLLPPINRYTLTRIPLRRSDYSDYTATAQELDAMVYVLVICKHRTKYDLE